ncbi:MAG: dihydroorotate dehydrogenase-like protein [Opitutaceae bacterium]|nr:dihydroorotate dehydrogenase-like protein [Opitutaceae bacterium]
MALDLSTTYLGIKLANPIMPGASPLVDSLDRVKAMQDAGASAIVMHSLFEEQIDREMKAEYAHLRRHEDVFAEAANFFPESDDYALGPQEYLAHIRKIKETCKLPVIASLNGTQIGGWVEYANLIQQAGADALELNLYYLATDGAISGEEVETDVLEIVRTVKAGVKIPVAVKLSPFFSSLSHMAKEIELNGADGLVLFNRFYQPDIDLEALEVVPKLDLSSPEELRLRLRWLAILFGQVKLPMACTGGVHSAHDVVKSILAGASVVQVVSSLLKHNPAHIRTLLTGLEQWMQEKEYASVAQMRGALSLQNCPDPAAFERANYLKILQVWRTN